MNVRLLPTLALLSFAGCAWNTSTAPEKLPAKLGFDMPTVERGRQLVRNNDCNDCHTRGYLIDADSIPVDDWLTGESFGWHGPWGVSYASNLRLLVAGRSQGEWIGMAKHLKARPLMPWSRLNDLGAEELAAIYQFIRYLGPKGRPAPQALPPE
jgi:hypothetical protein